MIDTTELRRLCAEASEAPWTTQDKPGCDFCVHDAHGAHVASAMPLQVDSHREGVRLANAAFIATARTALPALLDRVEALERVAEAARAKALDECAALCDREAELERTTDDRAAMEAEAIARQIRALKEQP